MARRNPNVAVGRRGNPTIGTKREALALLAQYRNGATLDDLGIQLGLSRERIRQIFVEYGLRNQARAVVRGRKKKCLARARRIVAEADLDELIPLGTAGVMAERLGIAKRHIPVLTGRLNRERPGWRGRHVSSVASRPDDSPYIDALRRAAKTMGQPLTKPMYDAWADVHGYVTGQAMQVHFGSWNKALTAAGLQESPPTRSVAYKRITVDECIEKLADILEAKKIDYISYAKYEAIASRSKGKLPSAPLVRMRVREKYRKGWPHAVDLARAVRDAR